MGLKGSVIQMINHGISTGALFLLVGVLYERRHTREISAYGGIAGVVPVTTALFLVASCISALAQTPEPVANRGSAGGRNGRRAPATPARETSNPRRWSARIAGRRCRTRRAHSRA